HVAQGIEFRHQREDRTPRTLLSLKGVSRGIRISCRRHPALSRIARPRQRTNRALEPREEGMLWSGWELEWKYRLRPCGCPWRPALSAKATSWRKGGPADAFDDLYTIDTRRGVLACPACVSGMGIVGSA